MDNFKMALESFCKIHSWAPTENQLVKIASALSIEKPTTLSNAQGLVSRYCPSVIYSLEEGVDHSDLRTLLMQAIKIAQRNSPK